MPVTRIVLIAAMITIAALLGVAPHNAPSTEAAGPGTWTAGASLGAARNEGTATLLPNGRVLLIGGTGSGGVALASAELYAPASDAWSAAGSMSTGRILHTATLLRNGKVLVTGGYRWDPGLVQLATAEIYTPSTNTWAPAAAMAHARSLHGTALLPDGRVLVAGGDNLGTSSSAEIYDPVTDSWTPAAADTPAPSAGSAFTLPDGRVYHDFYIYTAAANSWTTASVNGTFNASGPELVQLGDGRIMAYGGGGIVPPPSPYTNRAYIFDLSTATWNEVAGSAHQRDVTSGALLGNGKVLFSGGIKKIGGSPTVVGVTEVYDPATDTWAETEPLGLSIARHQTALLHDGRALVTGGGTASTQLFDPTAWIPVADMNAARTNPAAALLHTGKAFVVESFGADVFDPPAGSWTPTTGPTGTPTHDAITLRNGRVFVVGDTAAAIYNPANGIWTTAASPPTAAGKGAAVLLNSGRVLAVRTADPNPSTLDIYDPVADAWTTLPATVPAGRPTLARLADGRILISGGYLCNFLCTVETPQTTAWIFDPVTSALSAAAPMLDSRMKFALTTLNDGRVIATGGNGPTYTDERSSTEIYSPATNTWTAGPSLAAARAHHSASLLDDGAVLVAGGFQSPGGEDTAELLKPPFSAWTSAGTLPTPRGIHGATRLADGRVLLAGGVAADGVSPLASAVIYDLGVNTDTDGDGYNDGLELALNQHPWLHCKAMRADVTGDGIANVADIGRVASKTGQKPAPARIDQNGDKIINVADVGLTASQSGKSVLMCL